MPGITETLQFGTEVELGRAVFEAIPGHHAYNPIGVMQGGYVAAMLDSALGCAVHTMLEETQAYTTLEFKMSYGRAIRPRAVACARRHRSRWGGGGFAEATLTDAAGRVLASASSTLLVFARR